MTTPVGPTVIKIGGSTLDAHRGHNAMWAALAQFARTSPGGLVLVHGGGKAVDRHLARLGVVSERRQGLRVTPPDQIGDIVGVLAGSVNKSIVAELNRAGARAVGICLGDGAMTRCAFLRPAGVDLGCVGEVVRGDPSLPAALLAAGFLPVISSIGFADDGTALNVNADDAAAGLARAVRAKAVVLLTDVAGVRGEHGSIEPRLSADEIERLVLKNVITGGMIPKTRAAAVLAQDLGAPVVILSGEHPDALAAWAKGEDVGTTITA